MIDLKKVYKKEYGPKTEPEIINIKKVNYLAVKGKGNPNDQNGEYNHSIELLYGVAYTLKMSYKTDYKIKEFEEYVVPPLEGFWWIEGLKGVDFDRYDEFQFISLLRLPDFIKVEHVEWSKGVVSKKKNKDYSKVEFFNYDEGICVQVMHFGPYQEEPGTVLKMHQFMEQQGYQLDISDKRFHHEIYISDPRKTEPSKLKTILRHPIK